MKTLTILLSIVITLGLAAAFSTGVTTTAPFRNLTAKVNESLTYDLGYHITGYNLTYTTSNGSVAYVRPLTQNLSQTPFTFGIAVGTVKAIAGSFPQDNFGDYDYSSYAFFISDQNNFVVGRLDNSTASLIAELSIQITPKRNVRCYGAAQLTNDTVVVDCVSVAGDGTQTNLFYFISISQRTVVGSASQPASVNSVTDKTPVFRGVKIYRFKSSTYILRYIGSSAIADPNLKNDSIIEVYNTNQNPLKPQVAGLINKQTVGASKLNLTSFEVLNGTLFLLCSSGNVFRVDNYLPSTPSAVVSSANLTLLNSALGMTAAIEVTDASTSLIVIVWNSTHAFELNWFAENDYFGVQTYQLSDGVSNQNVSKLDFTTDFVFVHLTSGNSSSLFSFRRGSDGVSQTHSVTPVNSSVSGAWWGVDRLSNSIHYWNTVSAQNFRYQTPLLVFRQSSASNSSVIIAAVSYNATNNASASTNFSYVVINDNDFRIYPTGSGVNLTIEYPSTHSIDLDALASGPALTYNISYPGSVQDIANLSIPINITTKNIVYSKLSASMRNPGIFYWLLVDGYVLYSFSCKDGLNVATQAVTPSCVQNGATSISGQILSLVVTDDYVAAITSGNTSAINFWNISLSQFETINLGSPVNTCSDLTLSPDHKYLFCPQPYVKQITIWSFTPTGLSTLLINRSNLPSSVVPIFSPTGVVVSGNSPNYIFVNNRVSILVLNLALAWANNDGSALRVVDNVALDTNLLSLTGFNFAVKEDSIVVLGGSAAGKVVIQEYSLPNGDSRSYLIKQYSDFYSTANYLSGPGTLYSSAYTDKFLALLTDSTPATSYLVEFKAMTHANNNLVRRVALGTAGSTLISGVRSSLINADYVIVTGPGGAITARVVYDSDVFTFQAGLKDINSVSENSTIDVVVYSSLTSGTDNQNATYNIVTVNSQLPPVVMNNSNSSNNLNFVNISSDDINSTFVFNPSDFIGGTILNWNITTEKPEDQSKIELQTPVDLNDTVFNSSEFINDIISTSANFYALSDDSISVYNASNHALKNYIDSSNSAIVPNNQKCTHMVVDEDQQFSTLFCYDLTNTALTYLVTISLLSTTPFPITPFNATGLFKNVLSMKMVDNFIFVLESDGSGMNPNSRLHSFDYSNPYLPIVGQVVQAQNFSANTFQCNSFDILPLGDGSYRIYFSDARFGVRTIQFDGTNWLYPGGVNLFTDSGFAKLYIPTDTFFLGLAIVESDDTTNGVWVALSTDISRVFYVYLYTIQSGTIATLKTIFTKLIPGSNGNKIVAYKSMNNSYFACSSYSYNSTNSRGYLNVFNVTDQNYNVNPVDLRNIGFIDFPGALTGSRAFAFLNTSNSSSVKLWSAVPASNTSTKSSAVHESNVATSDDSTALNEHIIRPNYAIKILDPNISSDYMTLYGTNGNVTASVQFAIAHTGPNPPNPPNPTPDPKKFHWPWWATLLIVLGVLIIIGAIFAIVRHRKNQESDLDSSNDMHAPLTTNYA